MIKVGIIFGGKSVEHEISIRSVQNILGALDQTKYEPRVIFIDKGGKWWLNQLPLNVIKLINAHQEPLGLTEVTIIGKGHSNKIVDIGKSKALGSIDVVFPVMHGPNGEDGSIQGLFQLANLPYVGADILGSAIGMDKDVTKRLLREANIPIADYWVVHKNSADRADLKKISERSGFPFFVKPAGLGSSVGISKVGHEGQFQLAMSEAFRYSDKVLIEKNIVGREIECAVLGNIGNFKASVPGEVIVNKGGFYSYSAKYTDETGATLCVPADLSPEMVKEIQKLSIKVCETLCCEGMARVDFFLTPGNKLVVNEINTIPGFTDNSMFSKLWEVSGIPFANVIDELIQLAFERHNRKNPNLKGKS